MNLNLEKHSNTLELNKVLTLLSEEVSLPDTRELALSLKPSFDYNEVLFLNKQTEDAYMLSSRFASPSFGRVQNCISPLTRAEMGGLLTMSELLKIGELLRISRTVSMWRENNGAEITTSLDDIFAVLSPNKFLEDKILSSIKSEDEMSDNASVTLYNIRTKIRKASSSVREKLDKMIKGGSSKYLQDAIVTQREGRFVVPVKVEHKSDVPGLVHDTSSSGATLFVEPMAVVEINNEIRVLKSKEKEEIERILYELSADVSVYAEVLKKSFHALLQLDLIFAKASLGYKLKAVTPKINNIGKINLVRARHPLLNKDTVVPISLSLGYDYKMLIITGPNTGGKTVTLKTIGLLTLMTQCGLMLPCDDGTEISVFKKVLADIGDEQSIEQSLSTFSSHIKNIISILEYADKDTLILFDELCAGTDPVEGAALAESILEEVLNKGAISAATTHYAELKGYALEREGVQNASSEFDVETLRPTYRLLIGVPGRSNAFQISQKLGLNPQIVENAKGYVSVKDRRFDDVVSKLEQANLEALKDRETAEKLKQELILSKKSADKKLKEINAESEKIVEKAREKAEDILDFARQESNRLLTELEELKSKINKENASDSIIKARGSINKTLKQLEKSNDSAKTEDDFEDYVLPRSLKVGDKLIVKGFSKTADLIKIDGEKLTVSIGNIKTTVNIKDVKLELIDKSPKQRTVSGIKSKAERTISRELDIRGYACDEGLIEVDRFIDACLISGVDTATIIHGKGTGVLRDAVRNHLRGYKRVSSFRPGSFGEGENGVTIVTFK